MNKKAAIKYESIDTDQFVFFRIELRLLLSIIPNEFQDEGFVKVNNFCLRREKKGKDNLKLFVNG